MVSSPGPGLLGTRLNQLLDQIDEAILSVYADLGLPGFRPRYTPVARVVAERPGCTIRDVAAATGVTHSAASQTVARMVAAGVVATGPGADARTRVVTLTPRGRELLPVLEAEYAATTAAAIELEAELSMPLHELLDEVFAALARRPMRERILDADPELLNHSVPRP